MRPKSETSNSELLVPSEGIFYFRKYGTDDKVLAIISSYATLHWLSRIGKQSATMLREYDTWSPASSNFKNKGYQRLPTLIERVADTLIKQVPREKASVSSDYSSAAEFRIIITDRLMGNQANVHSEAILPRKSQSSYSSAVEFQYNTNDCAI